MERAIVEARVHAHQFPERIGSDVGDETLAEKTMKVPLDEAADQRAERSEDDEVHREPALRPEAIQFYESLREEASTIIIQDVLQHG